MATLSERRSKDNTWFQKENHVRPAKDQLSKCFIDPTLGTAGGTSGFVVPAPSTPPVIASAGLEHHYDVPDAAVNVTEASGIASAWADDGVGADDLAQGSASRRPAYEHGGIYAYNGWDIANGSLFAVQSAWQYAFVVYKHGDGTTTSSTSVKAIDHLHFETNTSGEFIDTTNFSAADAYVNGVNTPVAVPTGEAALFDGPVDTPITGLFILRGTGDEAAPEFADNLMMIREILLYDAIPTDPDIETIRTHLMSKWGI